MVLKTTSRHGDAKTKERMNMSTWDSTAMQSLISMGSFYRSEVMALRKRLDRPTTSQPTIDEVMAVASVLGPVDFRDEQLTVNPEVQLMSFGVTQWVSCGLPVIEMGHKFAAALLVSSVAKETVDALKRPWDSFMINVPAGLLTMHDPQKDIMVEVGRVLVSNIENANGSWSFIAWDTGMTLSLWRFGLKTEQLIIEDIAGGKDLGTISLTDLDNRVAALIGKLIITTCAALTIPEMVTPRNPKGHQAWVKAKGDISKLEGKAPPQLFTVGKPITVDFRARVTSYLSTGSTGKQLEVRTMVMGHFKIQNHGPKNGLRKTIWVEPYWRGPDEAPINAKVHVIKEP